jgi:Fic family protein
MFKPKFQITSEILNNLNAIEVIKEKITNCSIHPKEELLLKKEAVLSMVHNSTAIEGNRLNEFEVKKVLEGKTVNARSRDIYEVQNYKKALDYTAKRKSPLITEDDILKIHKYTTNKVLSKEQSGHFRKESVYVVRRTPISQEIVYTCPDYKKVSGLVMNLCKWINNSRKEKLSPILIAGIAHAELAAIHPFTDGNGRSARLLATLILYTEKYDFKNLFALDNYYNKNRPAYYNAIHLGKNYEERSNSSLTKWLEYFVEGFLAEMELVMDKIKPFLFLKKQSGKKIILSKQELQILDFLSEMNSITSKDIEEILTISKRTAQRYLLGLIKKGLIKKHGTKKDARYVL